MCVSKEQGADLCLDLNMSSDCIRLLVALVTHSDHRRPVKLFLGICHKSLTVKTDRTQSRQSRLL